MNVNYNRKKLKKRNDLILLFFFFRLYLRREGSEKERERNINVQETHRSVDSCTPPTGDLACNPGMCPDRELNRRPFDLQASTQPTEPHQPGLRLKN